MCGIAGFSLSAQEPVVRLELQHGRDEHTTVAYDLAYELLDAIEVRGKDATGYAQPFRLDGEANASTIKYHKLPLTASRYLKQGHLWGVDGQTVILHTRMGTTGSEKDPLNNHPVVVGDIVGVHNGIILNDDDLYENTSLGLPERQGEVDTEALFALIAKGGPKMAGEKASGDAAVAWLDKAAPYVLNLANFGGRPLWIGETKAGSVVFASTKQAVQAAGAYAGLTEFEHLEELKEGLWTQFLEGRCIKNPTTVGVITPTRVHYASSWNDRVCKKCDESSCVCKYSTAPLAPYPKTENDYPTAPKDSMNGQIKTINRNGRQYSRVLGGYVVPWKVWDDWRTATDKLKRQTNVPTVKAPACENKIIFPTIVCDFDQMLDQASFPWSHGMWRAMPVNTKVKMFGSYFTHAPLGTLKKIEDLDENRVVLLDVRLYLNRMGEVNGDGVFKLKADETAQSACLPTGTLFCASGAANDLKVVLEGGEIKHLGTYFKTLSELRELWRDELAQKLTAENDQELHEQYVKDLVHDRVHAPKDLAYVVRWYDESCSFFHQEHLTELETEDGKPAVISWVEHFDEQGQTMGEDPIPNYYELDDVVLSMMFSPTIFDITYFTPKGASCIYSAGVDEEVNYDTALERVLKAWKDGEDEKAAEEEAKEEILYDMSGNYIVEEEIDEYEMTYGDWNRMNRRAIEAVATEKTEEQN